VNTVAEKCLLPNMYLAGDWIKTAYPAALMERAVTTGENLVTNSHLEIKISLIFEFFFFKGREAANEALLKDNVRQAPMTVLSTKGPGLM